jgi:gamma-D-glutamyl-L-lysine dipeptidyl-peptidase
MKTFKLSSFLLPLTILILLHNSTVAQDGNVKSVVKSIQQKYAPDRRTAVFNINCRMTKRGLVVRGEVDNREARDSVIVALKKNGNNKIINQIQILPATDLGKKTYGIVLDAVGDMRLKPSKGAELLTQVMMGTVLKLLKKRNGYYFVQSPDKYLGWIEKGSLYSTTESGINNWNKVSKIIVVEQTAQIKQQASESSISICEVVAGCVFKSGEVKNGWITVEFADGRKGFLPINSVQELNYWKESRVLTGENLEKTAKLFLGIPYIWGGTSVRGMDCSGFIKVIYRLNGMELNRDANQQAEQGEPIDVGENFKNLQKGDLIFFGRKGSAKRTEHIAHVGMYLENKVFIHSSGSVRLSSFDPDSKYYDKSLSKKFVRARRIMKK